MSKTLESIESLKDAEGINENTYLTLMNSMKSDFDKGILCPNGKSKNAEDVDQMCCRIYLNIVKDCVSTCSTYNDLYEKSSKMLKTVIGFRENPPREIFDELIIRKRIQLLFPTGICRKNNEICIDTEVSVVKLKQLAKECKLKKFSSLKKSDIIVFLNKNLNEIKKHFNIK
tara:strand:- start:1431 stop:1946 length:516 start_codon:yes stop_codon:yes gene_type:complete